ncbi:MAG: NADH-ubiquinone oxidoreductase-F iron-sulfur binding region domain-containing protein [Parachlamydiaceae bacterium]
MAANSFCPLAVGAAPPVISAIREFKHEFEAYIRKNPDADKNPKMRIAYPYL